MVLRLSFFIIFIYSPLVFSFGGRSRRRDQTVVTPVDTLENPSAMIHSASGDTIGTPDRANCTPVSVTRGASEVSSLVTTMGQVSDHQACQPLGIGETRVSQGEALNGVRQDYAITRTAPNKYETAFTMNFQHDDPAVVSRMQDKVNECFEGINANGMSDPMGREVAFKMYTPTQAQALASERRPPPIDITIQDNMEPNAGNYHTTFDCATIVHETMHLMGLHDEYHNQRRADLIRRDASGQEIERIDFVTVANMNYQQRLTYFENPEYEREFHYNGCRAIIDAETLMKDHYSFFPQTLPTYLRCRCDSNRCKSRFMGLPEAKRNIIGKSQFILSSIKNFGEYCESNSSAIRSRFINANGSSLQDNRKITGFQTQGDNFSFTNSRYEFSEPDMRLRQTTVPYTCNCTAGETDCDVLKETLQRIQDRGVFSQMNTSCPYPAATVDKSYIGPQAFENLNPSNEFVLVNDAPGRVPMFRNAYVEKMIYPSCEGRASKYETCTQYSYRRAGSDCSDRPAYCGNQSWLDDI